MANNRIYRFQARVSNIGNAPGQNFLIQVVDAPVGAFTTQFLAASLNTGGAVCGVFGNSAQCQVSELSHVPGNNQVIMTVWVLVTGGNALDTDTFTAEVDPAPGTVPESNELNNTSTGVTLTHG
ncbi:MAG: hypothetical protein U0531_08595 [Dehalococcoidia bacterium]